MSSNPELSLFIIFSVCALAGSDINVEDPCMVFSDVVVPVISGRTISIAVTVPIIINIAAKKRHNIRVFL
jgi:hypothetical protein